MLRWRFTKLYARPAVLQDELDPRPLESSLDRGRVPPDDLRHVDRHLGADHQRRFDAGGLGEVGLRHPRELSSLADLLTCEDHGAATSMRMHVGTAILADADLDANSYEGEPDGASWATVTLASSPEVEALSTTLDATRTRDISPARRQEGVDPLGLDDL